MVSTVQARPSHYETLGLTPAASQDEIFQAFAREMSMFRVRPMAAVAQISVAYETLRNPAKRRAYDASLGLKSEPEPRNPPVPPARQDQPPFIGAAPAEEALPEQRLGLFIAESLRDPISTDEVSSGAKPEAAPLSEAKPRPKAELKPGVDLHLADLLAARRVAEDASARGGERSAAWKGPAMAAGVLVVAVGLAGALLGWRGANAPQQAEPDMAIALPAATPVRDVGAVSASPPTAATIQVPGEIKARPEQPAPAARTESIPPPPLQTAEEPQADGSQIANGQPAEKIAEPAIAGSPTTSPAAAGLPLSNAMVARTIGRIGYSCGQVASSEPVEGEGAGVFKVTCTSGQSYRAAPVHGRYHFRRWDRQ